MIQHLSVRVPWHDKGWDGTICKEPCSNTCCLVLKGIAERKDDSAEQKICGECLAGHEQDVPCIGEGAAFMSPNDLVRKVIHPYKRTSPRTHGHFEETLVKYPAYSLPGRPYMWLMKKFIEDNRGVLGVKYDPQREPSLNFNTAWVQEQKNHQAIFDVFYEDVKENQSLVLAYAKRIPFIDDTRRIIVGMGYVTKVVLPVEHKTSDKSKIRSMTWEAMLCHSIREDHKNGFVIPYQKMMEYAAEHPDFDLNSIVVYAPDDAFEEFSYATEHVSYDAVIDVILSCIKSFEIINSCLDEDYSDVLQWLNARLADTWKERGAFPGFGSMLTALGMKMGVIIGKEIKAQYDETIDFWDFVDATISNPPKNLANMLSVTERNTWKKLPAERKTLFKLLSRLSLNTEQAIMLYNPDERYKAYIDCSDAEIIRNPYILYEKTRLKFGVGYISVKKIDRAIFPVVSVLKKYPVPKPSALESDDDERRVRALAVGVLEAAALEGHTILPCNLFMNRIKEWVLEPACNITLDKLHAIDDFLRIEIIKKSMKDGTDYFKLVRMQEFDDVIEKRIKKRLKATPLSINADWRKMLDEKFDKGESKPLDPDEENARREKAAALEILAQSRVSVLVGDAGTGKTTVLSILCSHEDIKAGGILLMAPTGKATVRLKETMQDSDIKYVALNIAQFLVRSKRFNFDDLRYMLSKQECNDVPETVIVDESSMLTEEMFGALLQVISKAKRIIFVGDPNQLTPIGSGCPFVDLVNILKKDLKNTFPHVCNNYAELTVNRRQKDISARLDVNMARLFTGNNLEMDENVIAEIEKSSGEHIKFIKWDTREDLEDKLLNVIKDITHMTDLDDHKNFDKSLGGVESKGYMYFNVGCAKQAESWQILAPVRNMPQGVLNINRLIHLKYREQFVNLASCYGKYKRIPRALGTESIVYGDKVINVKNCSRDAYPLTNDKSVNYIANGEIGVACNSFSINKANDYLKVEFSSKPGMTFSYTSKDFDDENGSDMLELAYALTVHKSQGSQFNTVILVVAEPCRIITREMLYTALTRQQKNIIILYNDEPFRLLKYTSSAYSDIAKRLTDLFAGVLPNSEKPQVVEINGSFYAENKIHRTARNEMVRSKSEVIIANTLDKYGIPYEYEKPLKIDGAIKSPDFTIEDNDTGVVWYWEHLGMLSNDFYQKKWEEKKSFYKKHGIIEGENLIVTVDDEKGGLDSYAIDKLVKEKFEDLID